MARKSTKKAAEKKEATSTDLIYDQVLTDYGEDIMVGGDHLIAEPTQIISISPSMDLMTCGGIEEGSWVGITGNAKTGKTTMALQMAANAQKPENGSRQVFYSKVEGRLSTIHLRGISELNVEKPHFNVIQSKKGKILSGEDHLKILSKILMDVPNAFVIIDSISTLCEQKVLEEGIGTQTRGGAAKLFSQFLAINSNVVATNNSIVVGITQLMANTSGMGAKYQEKGGRAWQYQCDYQLRTVSKKNWENDGRVIGIEVEWKCNTSKLGPPGGGATSYLRFGVGIDKLYECIQYGLSVGLVKKAGAWYTLDYMQEFVGGDWDKESQKPYKAQGADKLYTLLQENPEWATILQKKVVDFISG